MSMQDCQNRLTKQFVPNSKLIFTLPLGGKIRKGNIVLTGTVVVSGGTTNGTAYGEGGPANLLARIIVNATPAGGSRYPGGKVVDAGPRDLIEYAIFQHNGKRIGELNGSVLGSGAAGTYQVYQSIPLYFADGNLRKNLSTCLNTDPGTYQSVQVEIDTGSLSLCFTGNDRTVDYSGLQVQWVDDRVAIPGDTLVRYQESHTLLIPATQDRALDEAMPQDGAFESWLIMAEQSSTAALSDNLLTRVRLNGPAITFDKYASDIRQAMLDDEWLDPAQAGTGLYYIDFTDAALSNTVDAGTLQTRLSVANVSGANLDSLRIFTRRVFAPVPASSK